jgi:hypothetical protein
MGAGAGDAGGAPGDGWPGTDGVGCGVGGEGVLLGGKSDPGSRMMMSENGSGTTGGAVGAAPLAAGALVWSAV